MMSWIFLVLAGLFEVCWAVGLKYTEGFKKPLPSVLVALAIAASMLFLSLATRTLPISTAYAVWVGIGALGATLCGAIFFGESFNLIRAICLLLLLVAIAGLKLTSRNPNQVTDAGDATQSEKPMCHLANE